MCKCAPSKVHAAVSSPFCVQVCTRESLIQSKMSSSGASSASSDETVIVRPNSPNVSTEVGGHETWPEMVEKYLEFFRNRISPCPIIASAFKQYMINQSEAHSARIEQILKYGINVLKFRDTIDQSDFDATYDTVKYLSEALKPFTRQYIIGETPLLKFILQSGILTKLVSIVLHRVTWDDYIWMQILYCDRVGVIAAMIFSYKYLAVKCLIRLVRAARKHLPALIAHNPELVTQMINVINNFKMPTNIREQKLMIKITKLAVMLFQANRAQYFLQLANVTTFELVLKMLVKLGDIEFWHGGMSFLPFFLLGIGMVGAAPEHRRTFYETVFPILVRVIDRIGPQSSYYESFSFSKIILYLGHLFAQEPIEPQVIIMEIVSSSLAKKLCDLLNVCTPEWYAGDMDRIKQVLALLLTLFIDQTASDEPALFYYLLVNAKPFPDFKTHLTERPYRQFCEATFKSYSWNCRW